MDKKEALGKKPALKKKLALGMKREKGEPPTKRVKENEDEEERYGRRGESTMSSRQTLSNLRGRHESGGRSRGWTHLWRKHMHNYLTTP